MITFEKKITSVTITGKDLDILWCICQNARRHLSPSDDESTQRDVNDMYTFMRTIIVGLHTKIDHDLV